MVEDFLAAMAAASAERARDTLAECSLDALRTRALASPAPTPLKRDASGFDLIAEIKLRAPSTGALASAGEDLAARARHYAQAGAASVSVLTEPERFAGSLAHLSTVADALRESGVPAMRKDFLVDPCQVWEAREAGAGGVLLILPILDDRALDAMLEAAGDAGLFVLLEAFSAEDLARCGRLTGVPDLLLGLNCRNLRDLSIEPNRFAELLGHFPPGPPRVAESGMSTAVEVADVARHGYDLALVGSALMQAPDPGALLAEMLAAARGRRE